MELAWATVIEGSETPAGDGDFGALRCVIETASGELLAAVLKRDPPELVFAEALCSILLSRWGLVVPRPFLIKDTHGVSFASADVGYPNLKQRVGLGPGHAEADQETAFRLATTLVSSFPSTPLALAIDEAIDNRDRNLGNILWDGTQEAWIDHALALGNGLHMDDLNKLCILMIEAGRADEALQGAIAQWLALNRSEVASAALAVERLHNAGPWQALIVERLEDLGARLTARFPRPDDLLADLR
ncbi:hypothetical protein ABM187_002730 [Stenotrophomonas maltophilia]